VQGHTNGEAILVTRRGDAYFATGASCTHYGGTLAEANSRWFIFSP
jgi:nitrite reductase/ring-hydroxylating ferredoxin subunit